MWPPVTMSPLLRIYQFFETFSQLLQFSPVDNKVKELVGPVALSELLAPLHIETRVELHNPDVLIVVRTVAGPGCARHHVASVHRIGSDLFKENYSPTVKEVFTLAPWAMPSMSIVWEVFRFPSRSKVQTMALPSSLMKRHPPSKPSVYPVATRVSPSWRIPRMPPFPL